MSSSDLDTAGASGIRAPYVRLDPLNPAIVSDAHDVSILAEEFRNLAFQVEEDSRRPRDGGLVVAVTSPESATGKTLLSLNLALALSRESDKKVLLLEGDLRRPTMHSYLQAVPRSPGLWQLLRDAAELEQAVLAVWGERLEVVLAGSSGKVANVMAQRRAAEILARARSGYDLVIIDAPPLLLASGRSTAARADRALLLIRAGHTRKRSIREALSILDPEKVLGLVLNAARHTPEHSYSRYRNVADWRGEAYPPHGDLANVEASPSQPDRATGSGPKRARWRLLAWLLVLLLILVSGLFWYVRLRPSATASGKKIPISQTTRFTPATAAAEGSAALGLPLIEAPPPPTPAEAPIEPPLKTRAPLNLRSGPGTDYPVLEKLSKSTALLAIERQGPWLQVASEDRVGWVHEAGTLPARPQPAYGLRP